MSSSLDASLKLAKGDQFMALVDKLEAQLASRRFTADKFIIAAVAVLTNS